MSSHTGTSGRLVLWRHGQRDGEFAVGEWTLEQRGTHRGPRRLRGRRRISLDVNWKCTAPAIHHEDWIVFTGDLGGEGEITVIAEVAESDNYIKTQRQLPPSGVVMLLIPHNRLPEEFTASPAEEAVVTLSQRAAESVRQGQDIAAMPLTERAELSPVARAAAVAQALAAAGVTTREAARALSNDGRATVSVVADASAFHRAMERAQAAMDEHTVAGSGTEPPLGIVEPISSEVTDVWDSPATSSLSGVGPSDVLLTSDMTWAPESGALFPTYRAQPSSSPPTKPAKPKYGPETFFTRRRVRPED